MQSLSPPFQLLLTLRTWLQTFLYEECRVAPRRQYLSFVGSFVVRMKRIMKANKTETVEKQPQLRNRDESTRAEGIKDLWGSRRLLNCYPINCIICKLYIPFTCTIFSLKYINTRDIDQLHLRTVKIKVLEFLCPHLILIKSPA